MKDSTVASGLDGKEQGVIIDVCPGHSNGKCGGTHLPSFVIHLLCTLMTWGHLSEYLLASPLHSIGSDLLNARKLAAMSFEGSICSDAKSHNWYLLSKDKT